MSGKQIGMVRAEGERRRRLKVLDWGENPNSSGRRVYVGERLVRAFESPVYPYRLVALDYEHNTEPVAAAYKETREPRDIAGYGVMELAPGDGVYMTMVLWAAEPDGWEAAHRYADISANPVLDEDGEVVAIKSVALTRAGATDKHFLDVPLSAAGAAGVDTEVHPHDSDYCDHGVDRNGVIKKGEAEMEWKKFLIELLGLKAEATDEDIKAALAALKTKVQTQGPEPRAAGGGDQGAGSARGGGSPGAGGGGSPGAAPLAAEVAGVVNAAVAPLAAQMAALQAENHKRSVERVLEGARLEGKVVPLSAEAALGLELKVLEEIVAQTPVTVPLSAVTPARVREPKLEDAGPTAAQRAIAEQCGVAAEKVWPGKAG